MARTSASHALAFLANDRYFDWTTIFLESVRSRDPTLPLYCIPHGEPMSRVRDLRGVFRFDILEDGLDRLDALARRLFPGPEAERYRGNLRKYAALTLPVDEVAYFDVDIVMLVEPRRLFGHIGQRGLEFLYLAPSPDWVYAPERMAQALSLFPDMQLFSAGAFVTSPASLSIAQLIDTIDDDRELYSSLRHPRVFDQSVINFVLHRLRKSCGYICDIDDSLSGMVWSRDPHLRMKRGRVFTTSHPGDVAAVHWAGDKDLTWSEALSAKHRRLHRLRRALHHSAERRIRAQVGPWVSG